MSALTVLLPALDGETEHGQGVNLWVAGASREHLV